MEYRRDETAERRRGAGWGDIVAFCEWSREQKGRNIFQIRVSVAWHEARGSPSVLNCTKLGASDVACAGAFGGARLGAEQARMPRVSEHTETTGNWDMKMKRLGRTDIMVSELCLGTMTFGTQTPEHDAHRQLDLALDAGLNFLDTAEMYPVNPVRAETVGRSEEIIGNWIAKSGRRADYVVATKHSGEGLDAVRNGAPISGATLNSTIEGSLKRLKTDCIDLYQFHWPNRGSYCFRRNWDYDPGTSGMTRSDVVANMEEVMEGLKAQVDKGNIRAFGLSNDSAWGTAQWLALAEKTGGPRVSTIQNEYSLLYRMYDTDLAELSHYEDVGLLTYSPLATGLLTGKYQNGQQPEGSRLAVSLEHGGGDLGGRLTARAGAAVAAYLEIAERHGLDPVHMALAWCNTRPFMASSIFGATTEAQLSRILAGKDVTLTDAVLADINAAHRAHPMPF